MQPKVLLKYADNHVNRKQKGKKEKNMTSVNNSENNRKFYQFLQQQGGISGADANGDGAVTKTEFRKFLEENDFDFSALDGWNGEKAAKSENDLINKFWASINTNSAKTKIKGTRVRNSAALDEKEQQAILNRLEAEERLQEFVANLKIPSFIDNQAACRQEIQEKLMALVESDILKKGKDLSTLSALLEENAPLIRNQVSANTYASECMAEYMGDLARDYNYKYADDKTLNTMIKNLVKKMDADVDESEIQEAIEDLVKGYLATAKIGDGGIPAAGRTDSTEGEEIEEGISADAVWYNPTENSPLNDLQKAVLETELKASIEKVVTGYADYEAYKDLYDKAASDFIAETLKNAKYGTFESVKAYGKAEFENSEIGQKLLKTVQIKKLVGSDKFTKAISNELTKTLADYINENRRYLKAMATVENEVLEKAMNGEYGEPIDESKIIADIVKYVKAHIAEFYTNGFGDMDLETLNKTYDIMKESAVAEKDAEKSLTLQREAAIKYCDNLVARSNKFKEEITRIIGEDYKSVINSMMPSEINEKISKLKSRVLELGDAKSMTLDLAAWSSTNLTTKVIRSNTGNVDLETVRQSALNYLPSGGILGAVYYITRLRVFDAKSVDEILDIMSGFNNWQAPEGITSKTESSIAVTVRPGATTTFNIAAEGNFKDKNGKAMSVTSDRITYKSSNSIATVDAQGKVTITGGKAGTSYDVTISVLVDGVEVSTMVVKVKCELGVVGTDVLLDSISGWGNNANNPENLKILELRDGDSCNYDNSVTSKSLKDLYNSNAIVKLYYGSTADTDSLIKSTFGSLLGMIVSAFSTIDGINTTALEQARQQVFDQYTNPDTYSCEYSFFPSYRFIGSFDDDGYGEYDTINNLAWNMRDGNNGYHRIAISRNDDEMGAGKQSAAGVRIRDVVDDLIAAYNSLIS